MNDKIVTPILPWKRPIWLVVLLGMLVFGFYQELAKVYLNHYIDTVQRYPELESLGAAERAGMWQQINQPKRLQYYVIRGTWSGFHTLSLKELVAMKWIMSVFILLVFFVFDGLFLKTTGHLHRWPWLVVIYGMAGLIMAFFMLVIPGKTGYSVSHEFLAFLQSPLPSFLIVLVPSLLERMRQNEV
tara:strand:+ start:1178 stop:1735 length:558 start_codon:yes stop_codon:yes gene_type:complete